MLRQIDIYSEAYGKSDAEIEAAILARSHAAWKKAGRPIAPPDERGHILVAAGAALSIMGGAVVVLVLLMELLVSKDTILVQMRRFVDETRVPAGFDIAGIPFIAAVLLAVALVGAGVLIGMKGQQMLRKVPQELAEKATSSRNKGRRAALWALSIAVGAAGTYSFAQPFLSLDQTKDLATYLRTDFPPAAAGLCAFIAALYIADRARRLAKPSAAELQAKDPRAPILLLRSFNDENLKTMRVVPDERGGNRYQFVRLEDAIADQFAPYGPLVAIGRPGEPLPTTGAARNYYSDAEWKDAVGKWLGEAQVILVIAGLTKGLGWELDAIERRGHIAKLAVMMPPAVTGFGRLFLSLLPVKLAIQGLAALGIVRDHSAPVRRDLQQRWDVLRHAVAKVEAFAALPEQVPEGLLMVHLGRDGVPTLLIGSERSDEADYELAVRLAIYGIQCHA